MLCRIGVFARIRQHNGFFFYPQHLNRLAQSRALVRTMDGQDPPNHVADSPDSCVDIQGSSERPRDLPLPSFFLSPINSQTSWLSTCPKACAFGRTEPDSTHNWLSDGSTQQWIALVFPICRLRKGEHCIRSSKWDEKRLNRGRRLWTSRVPPPFMAISRNSLAVRFRPEGWALSFSDPDWLHELDDRETTGPSHNDEMDIPYFGTVLPGLCRSMPSLLPENR